jgi:hypothetical protein
MIIQQIRKFLAFSFSTESTASLGPGLCFFLSVSRSFLQMVGLLGQVISSSQGLYVNTEQHKHRINTYTYQISIPCVGLKPTIPASERAKTVHALDRSATVTGSRHLQNNVFTRASHRTLSRASRILSTPLHSMSSRFSLTLFSHICLGLQSHLFFSDCTSKMLYQFVIPPMHAEHPANLISFHFQILILLEKKFKLCSSSSFNSFQSILSSALTKSNILNILFQDVLLNFCFSQIDWLDCFVQL